MPSRCVCSSERPVETAVAAAASPRFASAEDPRRGRGRAAIHQRTIHVPAAAAPRFVKRTQPRRRRASSEAAAAAPRFVGGTAPVSPRRFNKGLGKALRHCEEAHDRKVRSKVTLEQLKLAVARFRSKLEGKPFATPSNAQLGEYLRELDTKLTVKMKAVSEALASEDAGGPQSPTSPGGGGASFATQQGSPDHKTDTLLPFGKLQSEKLQKMLYHKLMLTNPDQGPRNVRVRVKPSLSDLERYAQRKLMTGGAGEDKLDLEDDVEEFAPPEPAAGAAASSPDHAPPPGSPDDASPAEKEDETVMETVVDRDTVKRLSTLICQKNPVRKEKSEG